MSTRKVALVALLACPLLATAEPDCSWKEPGANPYTGSIHTAVMSYKHIEYWKRVALSLAVQYAKPHDQVEIYKDRIVGSAQYVYEPGLNDMHFGRNQRCAIVTREGWAPGKFERADVWRFGPWTIVKPHVCGNIAWTVSTQILPTSAARAVPEPSSLWLALIALVVIAFLLSRKKP